MQATFPVKINNKMNLKTRSDAQIVQLFRHLTREQAKHRFTTNGETYPLTQLLKSVLAELEVRKIEVINP